MQIRSFLFFLINSLSFSVIATPLCYEIINLPCAKEVMAYVIDVYDGDTCTVVIKIWSQGKQSVMVTEAVRMYGIDTDEIRTTDLAEKERGYVAKQFTADRILNKTVRLELIGREKYGRLLATVFYVDENGTEINLSKELIACGHAKEYFGGKRSATEDDDTTIIFWNDLNDPYDSQD